MRQPTKPETHLPRSDVQRIIKRLNSIARDNFEGVPGSSAGNVAGDTGNIATDWAPAGVVPSTVFSSTSQNRADEGLPQSVQDEEGQSSRQPLPTPADDGFLFHPPHDGPGGGFYPTFTPDDLEASRLWLNVMEDSLHLYPPWADPSYAVPLVGSPAIQTPATDDPQLELPLSSYPSYSSLSSEVGFALFSRAPGGDGVKVVPASSQHVSTVLPSSPSVAFLPHAGWLPNQISRSSHHFTPSLLN